MSKKPTFSSKLFGFLTILILVVSLNMNTLAQPPGSTCENPLIVDPVAAPLVSYAINSEAYGNDYTSAMITPTSSYLNGYDIVFQFTLAQKSFINASIAGEWSGLIFVATCPNATTPAPRLAFAGGSTGATVPQFALDAGSYFMIAGTYPAPDFTSMVINFSAVAVPLEPAIVVNPNPLNVGFAVPAFDTKTASLSIRNDGIADLLIADGGFVLSGVNAANFSVQLSAGDTYPLTIPFGVTKVVSVVFNPSAVGAASADLTITYNNTTTPTVVVPVSGTGYLPSNAFSQNFDGVDPIPAGWLPDAWSKIVQSTATAAVVDVRNIGSPVSLPNHVRLFNSTDVGATVMLVSPAAVNLTNSWVRFAAKMSSSTHTANVLVGYMTNNYDPATFVSVGSIGVTGTYAQYNVSFLGSGFTFPETAYVAFKFAPSVASRTLYIDNIFYEAVPTHPVFTANKTEVNFGTSVFVNETAANTLQISNTGAGILTINQADVTLTGADAAAFNIVYPATHTWPIALSTGQTFTFDLRFSPTQTRAYVASLNIQDNIGSKALNTIPLLGSGYDATLQPGFLFDFTGTWPPLNWRKFKGLFGTEPVLPTADAIWVHDQFGNNPDLIDPNSAKINLYGTTRRHWLMSPPINLGDGSQGYQLEFDLALTFFNATTAVTLSPEQKFAVVVSTDGGLTWSMDNVLKWWNETTPISNTGDHVILDLSAYSGRVMLGFYGEMTVSTAGTIDYDLFVRNVTVTEAVDIEYPEPRNLTASDAGMAAQLSWIAPLLNPTTIAGFGEDHSSAYRSNMNQPNAEYTEVGRLEKPDQPKGSKSLAGRGVLYDNGPFINSPGTGPDGADQSILQNTSLGMSTLGSAIQFASGNRMADDLVVNQTWTVEAITVFAYQTGSSTTSTMTGGYVQVWDGDPTAGGQVIWGDIVTNRMTSTAWTNSYRLTETTPGTTRPIMRIVMATPQLVLEPGTYWIDYTLEGSLASGPWAPPITINGQAVTGNAKQYFGSTSAWQDFRDTGTGTPAQGLPFIIEGYSSGSGGAVNGELLGYNIYRNGTLIGNTTTDVLTYLDNPLDANTYTFGVSAIYGQPYPGESAVITTNVTIEQSNLTVSPSNHNVSSLAGNTSFNVTSNTSWTVSENVSWLTVNPLSGNGDATLNVDFESNTTSAIRTGQITITASGGSPEVSVTVTQSEQQDCLPLWEPISSLQYNMQVVAQILIDGQVSLNPNDVLGAFVGEECRGIASPQPEADGLIFLTVGSDVASGEQVELKIWNSTDCSECNAIPGFEFVNQAEVGTFLEPYQVRCGAILDLSFGQGYTWFSLNVNPGNMSPASLFTGLTPCYDDRVIGQTSFALYTGSNWIGSLTSLGLDKMYRMKLCSAQNLSLMGEAAALNPINLAAGFTWLGYHPQECQSVSAAMAGLNPGPSYDDRVIGQSSFALYTGTAWIGSLTQLCPGKGYIVKLANAQSLTYPAGTSKGSPVVEAETISPTGVYPVENMQHTMMVMAQLRLPDGSISLNEKDVVYAMIDGEVRAIGHPMVGADGIIFLSIAENTEQPKPITFMVWLDEQQQLLPLNETLSFEPLAAIGNLDNPFILTLGEMVGVNEMTDGVWIGEPYPNPFYSSTSFAINTNQSGTLSLTIYNAMGSLVYQVNDNHLNAGQTSITIEKAQLRAGMYHYTIEVSVGKRWSQKTGKLIIQ